MDYKQKIICPICGKEVLQDKAWIKNTKTEEKNRLGEFIWNTEYFCSRKCKENI